MEVLIIGAGQSGLCCARVLPCCVGGKDIFTFSPPKAASLGTRVLACKFQCCITFTCQ